MRDLIALEFRDHPAQIEAGDVSGHLKATIWNNGDWFFSAALSDDGDIAGDFFTVEIKFNAPGGKGARLEGHLDAGEARDFMTRGNDPFIRENWHLFRNAGSSARLRVTADVGGVIAGVLFPVLVVLTLGLIVVPVVDGSGEIRRCRDQDPFNHDVCLEVVPKQH
ncbi:hypothetical protein [Streptomyces kanasensis]|uniref:hypothetical protein n=1 Tax=Streptomyces kanasensis TaxID=936756 RepID=UPI003820E037